MTDLETLKEIISLASDTGMPVFYLWLGYKVFADLLQCGMIVFAAILITKAFKYMAEN